MPTSRAQTGPGPRVWAFALALALAVGASLAAGPAVARTISARVGTHPGFTRVVFAFSQRVPYTVRHDGSRVEVRFKTRDAIDIDGILKDKAPQIKGVRRSKDSDGVAITFVQTTATPPRDFYIGTRVVIDFMAGNVGADLPPLLDRPQPAAVARANAGRPLPSAVPEPAPSAVPTTVTRPENAGTIASEINSPIFDPAAATLTRISLQVKQLQDGLRLGFPWPQSVPAAVFVRAGYLWVIFGTAGVVDLRALNPLNRLILDPAGDFSTATATILRFRLKEAREVAVSLQAGVWRIDLINRPVSPRVPIEIRRRNQKNLATRIYIPATQAGQQVAFVDPEIGDLVVAVPLHESGHGLVRDRRYADFRLLPSPQGLAVVPLSDAVVVDVQAAGITVSGADFLSLAETSAKPDKGQSGQTGDMDADAYVSAQSAPAETTQADRLIDFATWGRGPESRFSANERQLLYALATAGDDGRQAARRELARFYLAHGRGAEAIGVLNVMAGESAVVTDDPRFLMLRGIANVLLARYREADSDLSHPKLDSEPHIALWRLLVEEAQGRYAEALDDYTRGTDVLWEYDEVEQARFRLAAVRAALAVGDIDLARSELVDLTTRQLPVKYASETELLRGRLFETLDEDRNALVSYEKVIAADYRPTRVRAQFARTEVLLRTKAITLDEAIENLERLRYAWRGDAFELQLLDRLGHHYILKGDYHAGLGTLRAAVTYFGKTARTKRIAEEMSSIFRRLFLGNEADKLPAVKALALYYDFRELTPIGNQGDEMIRHLVDRLVKVDLLDRAAELLKHQVTYRLKGTPQAQVAARLAVIYLLDGEPQKALDILDETRQPRLPPELAQRRRYLEVQGLAQIGDYDRALKLLAGDTGDEAEALRGDIYWRSQDWPKLAEHVERQLGRRWQSKVPLAPHERYQVLRLVVSLALDDDSQGLADVKKRYGALMANGPFARAFDVITSRFDYDAVELSELVKKLADVSIFEGFLASYRDEMSGASISALN